MLTLFELTRQVAEELMKGGIWQGESTDATTTTITDATIGLITQAMDGGTIWLFDQDPPVTRIITDGPDGAGVVTFTPAVTDINAQRYMLFGKVWPRHALRSAVNRALRNVGEFADFAFFNSVGLQEDYDLSMADVGGPISGQVRSVERSAYSDPSTATNPSWMLHYGWTQIGDTLRFLADPPVYDGVANLRVGFNIFHSELTADDDEIRREVQPSRLKWEAVAQAYLHLVAPRDSEAMDEETKTLYGRAVAMANTFPAHINQPLPAPMLFLGVGSRGAASVNPDLQV